jgi:hypothetical protein
VHRKTKYSELEEATSILYTLLSVWLIELLVWITEFSARKTELLVWRTETAMTPSDQDL